jgi:hypothetical protein
MVFNRVPLAVLLLGIAGVAACTTVRRVQPAQFFATNSPDVVWVTYTNDTIVPVAQPEIAGDTLRGLRLGTRKPVVIPLDEVRSVRAKVTDATKTTVLVTGALVGFVASVYAIWVSKAGSKRGGVDCGINEDAIFIQSC